MSLQLTDGEALSHTDLTLMQRISLDHVRGCELAFLWELELCLCNPAREEANGRFFSLFGVDTVDVFTDFSVVDEGHPGLEALLDELVLLLRIAQMPGVEILVLVRVEVSVPLDMLKSTSVCQQDDVEVTRHSDGGLECRDGRELTETVNEGDETDCQHDGHHTHEELLLALAQVVDNKLHRGHQDSIPRVWLQCNEGALDHGCLGLGSFHLNLLFLLES